MAHSYAGDIDELQTRLRKIEGQVRGLQRMLSEDAYCVDVLTQISAVASGLEKVGLKLLREHMRGCVSDAIRSKGDGDQAIDEVVKVVERFMAS